MFSKIREMVVKHVKNNFNTFFFLLMAFIIGVSAGAFTVNGLSAIQREELMNYFQGFIQLLDNQKVDTNELLKISIYENVRIVGVLWVLGVTIIGIPFIFIIVGIRGFITGFSSGFIIETLGLKGALFTVFGLLPKEFIIVPCIIALGVNGINFSLNIIKNKSVKHISRENIKTRFLGYCFVTLFYTCFIFIGVLIESYVTPVFIRMLSPMVT
ncbi:MAG: stage II sporulation protein M [Clostridia bacterium]|nr:stage II sporulation protein M [Clostridia bacterium]